MCADRPLCLVELAGWLGSQTGGTRPGGGNELAGGTRPGGGNELVPRAHSYIQVAASRIQDTGYYMLQGDTGYRILHATRLKFSKDTGHIGYRMQD